MSSLELIRAERETAAALTRRSALAALCVAGLAPVVAARAGDRPSVVATTSMIGDLANQLGGEGFAIRTLMGPGVDPHLYKATRSDTAAMLRADLVLYNGLFLEGKTIDAIERLDGEGRRAIALAETIDPARLLRPEAYEGNPDPHLWMDPALWSEVARAAADALAELGEPRAVREAAERHLAEIAELDAWSEERLATIPEDHRVLVTAHDAFGYFGRRYGFRVEGVQGLSTASEAGIRRIEELADFLVENAIPAVFVESSIAPRSLEALQAGARARGHDVAIGGELFSDAMGPPGTWEGTYLGMIDHNVTTIVRALGGEAPAGGWRGRLLAARRQ